MKLEMSEMSCMAIVEDVKKRMQLTKWQNDTDVHVYKKAHFTLILQEFHVILYLFSPQPQALCLTLISINMLAAGDIIQGNKRSVDHISCLADTMTMFNNPPESSKELIPSF